MNTSVRYENDTKVATSGNTVTFYRIGLKLEPNGKKALMSLRENDKEQLRYALERLIDIGIEKVKEDNIEAIDEAFDELSNIVTLRCTSDKTLGEFLDILNRLPIYGAYPMSETLEIHSEYSTFDIEYDEENEEKIMDYIKSVDGLNRIGE